ncbi:thioredoxin [Paenibacillus sp. J31TS4]|uniref:thioredoxin family protein n=1 Tax=Paenibacillus sp. J31TS4 TaxID=2807195 RepID=UPI001B24A429|nr:thioredoxin family protein [Paenibacillus sp. J31TS4]GIP36779.1 thioredoxin [Paenibacillus sp. J31TS4]
MSIREMDTQAFEEAIERKGTMLVEFGAVWCPPCRVLLPILEEIEKEREGRLPVWKVDCDASPELAARFGITGMPTVLVFRDGEPQERLVGLQSKQAYLTALARHAE